MKRHDPVELYLPKAEALAPHIVRFFNAAYGRSVRGSRQLTDAIAEALQHKYSVDEIRSVFWVARCLTGKAAWLGEAMRTTLLPDIALRFKAGINPRSGAPAVRWLDEMLARAGEVNPTLTKALMETLPEEMRDEERNLLHRMGIPIND